MARFAPGLLDHLPHSTHAHSADAAPRVNDRRVLDRVRQKLTSAIVPPNVRRSPRVESVLPLLYLHGLSSGDFREALPALLGPDAAGLSSSAILRLTKTWTTEYELRSSVCRG